MRDCFHKWTTNFRARYRLLIRTPGLCCNFSPTAEQNLLQVFEIMFSFWYFHGSNYFGTRDQLPYITISFKCFIPIYKLWNFIIIFSEFVTMYPWYILIMFLLSVLFHKLLYNIIKQPAMKRNTSMVVVCIERYCRQNR